MFIVRALNLRNSQCVEETVTFVFVLVLLAEIVLVSRCIIVFKTVESAFSNQRNHTE